METIETDDAATAWVQAKMDEPTIPEDLTVADDEDSNCFNDSNLTSSPENSMVAGEEDMLAELKQIWSEADAAREEVLSHLEEEKSVLVELLDAANTEVETLRLKYEEDKETWESHATESDARQTALEEKIQELQQSMSDGKTRMTRLLATIEELHKTNNDLSQRLLLKAQENESDNQRREELADTLRQMETILSEKLHQETESSKRREIELIEKHAEEKQSLSFQINELKAELETSKEEITNLIGTIQDIQKRNDELNTHLQSILEQKEEQNQQMLSIVAEKEAFVEKFSAEEKKTQELEGQVEELLAANEAKQSELTVLSQTASKAVALQQECASLTDSVASSSKRIEELESQYETVMQEKTALKAMMDRLTEENAKTKSKFEQELAEQAYLRSQAVLKAQEDAQLRIDAVNKELLDAQKEIAMTQIQAKGDLRDTTNQLRATKEREQNANLKIASLQHELDTTKSFIADKEAQADKMVAQAKKATERAKVAIEDRQLLFRYIRQLTGSFRVYCRIRPREQPESVLEMAADVVKSTEIECPMPNHRAHKKRYIFDGVFSETASQTDVFDEVEPLISSCLDGGNVSVIAYGQTGTGKTHTMMGTPENPGVIRRAFERLILLCESQTDYEYALQVSIIEIYIEKVVDLLSDEPADQQNHEVRTDAKRKTGYIPTVLKKDVASIEDVVTIIEQGEKNRSVASTKMNSASSRSHLIITLSVTAKNLTSGRVHEGQLALVDLAGSERASKTGNSTGKRMNEMCAINKSLTTLGQCITSIKSGDKHIPFRNSKLTQLLQSTLGVDGMACVFVTLSTNEDDISETASALSFGAAIRVADKKVKSSAIPVKQTNL
eukprot:m.10417 g.10417  ORF g.10417 m.10417 type:complete len:849 (+) comp4256_c0_seq1:171-2717(+)